MTDTTENIEEEKVEPRVQLYRKIANVMKAVDHVEKTGRNDFHKYDYATEADVLTALRKACIDQGLIILPDMHSSSVELDVTTVEIRFTIIDTETGIGHTLLMGGQGQDKGDKGIYKAVTGANKYFLLKTFMIPTGDDPEKDSAESTKRAVVQERVSPEAAPVEKSEATQAVEAKLNSVHREPTPDQTYADEYDEDGSNRLCDVCGEVLGYKEGVSGKTGKPWKGWFCSDKEHPVQWVR